MSFYATGRLLLDKVLDIIDHSVGQTTTNGKMVGRTNGNRRTDGGTNRHLQILTINGRKSSAEVAVWMF